MSTMNRRRFLAQGGALAAVACTACLGGCANPVTSPATNVDFTIDLSTAPGSALAQVGASMTQDNVLVIHVASGYLAFGSQCTHAGAPLAYRSSGDIWCSSHGSTFALDGTVTQGPARTPLTAYKTTLDGQSLRVSS